ncbi:MAG: alpha/beta fold hydrolase [Chloroflexota bacterium]
MQIATDTELITFEGWTLRVRPSQNAKRLMVLIHGWTGDENSMWVFTRGLPSDYWIIAPRAPHVGEPSGYSWRPPQPGTFGRPSLETLKPASDSLLSLVDAYSSSVGVDAKQFDLMGFSQGAAMVNLMGMLHPKRIRKVAVLAGFVPSGMEDIIAKKPLEGKQIFVAHGTKDEMVPVERAHVSIELLERAGAKVTYCEDGVGHKVSVTCLRALEDYFAN